MDVIQNDTDVATLDDVALDKMISEPENSKDAEPVTDADKTTETVTDKQTDSEGKDVKVVDKGLDKDTKTADIKEEQISVSKTEFEKLQARIKQQEDFIQRQKTEVGNARKRAEELEVKINQKIPPEELSDMILNDPEKAMEYHAEKKDAERELRDLQVQLAIDRNREIVHERYPNYKELVDDIVVLAQKDGYPEENIIAFKHNPYLGVPEILVSYAERATKERQIKVLSEEVEKSKKETNLVAKKIADAAKGGTSLNASSGKSSTSKIMVDESQLHELSDAELDAYLAENP